MEQELVIALVGGLGAMFGWGLADFFAKKTVDRVGSIVSLVWAHVFGTIAFITIALCQLVAFGKWIAIPGDASTWGLLAFFGALQAVVYLLVYKGFEKGLVAVLSPVFASYSGLAALASIVLFGETLSSGVFVALVIIFSGILLLNLDIETLRKKRINLAKTPGLKEVGIAAILAALWTVSWDRFVGGQDWVSYALFMYAFMTAAAFFIAKWQKTNLSAKKTGVWKFFVLIGACEAVAYLTLSLGFSATTYTSIVALLSGAFSLPTMVLARIFLKEKVTSIQTIGSIVIISGIIILSLM